MSWVKNASPDDVAVWVPDVSHPLLATSTSTVLANDGDGRVRLRMFGVDPNQVADRTAIGPPADVVSPVPADTGDVAQDPSAGYNICYLNGDKTGDAATASASDLLPIVLTPAAAGYYPANQTVNPGAKANQRLNLTMLSWSSANQPLETAALVVETSCRLSYKDVNIVALPNGKGRLMLLARYARPEVSDDAALWPNGGTVSPDNSMGTIVCYWAPDDDPAFTGDAVRGPFWLVNALYEFADAEAEVCTRIPLWIGVPAGVVVEEDDGRERLYLYYVAEGSLYPNSNAEGAAEQWGFQNGIWLRKIWLDDLLNVILYGGATYRIEELWDELNPIHLVAGETTGKVRVWLACGTEFDHTDEAVADGNVEIEKYYPWFKCVDPAPARCGQRLILYFCGNSDPDLRNGSTPSTAGTVKTECLWGIWRAAAIGENRTDRFGADFVVYASTEADLGDHDLLVVSTGANAAPTSQLADLYLDPDPVLLPDGTWLVSVGLRTSTGSPAVPTSGPLTCVLGSHASGCAPPRQAWTQDGLHFVVGRTSPR